MNPFGAVALNRVQPAGPAAAFQTFEMRAPLPSHWRPGTCEEDDCDDYLNGFYIDVDEADLAQLGGAARARFIRGDRTRRHTEEKLPGGLTRFVFPPDTRCFARHLVRSSRPAMLLVRGGDHRGNPDGFRRVHTRAEDWTEHLHETLDRVQAARERG